MNLSEAIDQVLELTGAIENALARGDHQAALEMVPVRGMAMERFQVAHRNAAPEELRACRRQLLTLKQRDERLQLEAGAQLQATAAALQDHATSRGNRPENQTCLTGCLDRRA